MKTLLLATLLCSVSLGFTIEEVRQKIVAYANLHGIDPDLAVAVGKTESSLKWNAVGGLGEVGPLQRLFPEGEGDVKNLDKNIESGILYLKEAKDKWSHKYSGHEWVVHYNLGVYHKRLNHPKKFEYYVRVTKHLNKIKVKRYLAQQ